MSLILNKAQTIPDSIRISYILFSCNATEHKKHQIQTPTMPQPSVSLLRYENPILVSRVDKKVANVNSPSKSPERVAKKLPPVDDKGRPKTPTTNNNTNTGASGGPQTEDILSAILPPR